MSPSVNADQPFHNMCHRDRKCESTIIMTCCRLRKYESTTVNGTCVRVRKCRPTTVDGMCHRNRNYESTISMERVVAVSVNVSQPLCMAIGGVVSVKTN